MPRVPPIEEIIKEITLDVVLPKVSDIWEKIDEILGRLDDLEKC